MKQPEAMSCQDLYDHLGHYIKRGRGGFKVMLDNRGLGFLLLPEHAKREIGVCLPPPGEAASLLQLKVFVRAAF